MRVETARRFTADCHKLGITIHGTFILSLPGETRETEVVLALSLILRVREIL